MGCTVTSWMRLHSRLCGPLPLAESSGRGSVLLVGIALLAPWHPRGDIQEPLHYAIKLLCILGQGLFKVPRKLLTTDHTIAAQIHLHQQPGNHCIVQLRTPSCLAQLQQFTRIDHTSAILIKQCKHPAQRCSSLSLLLLGPLMFLLLIVVRTTLPGSKRRRARVSHALLPQEMQLLLAPQHRDLAPSLKVGHEFLNT